MYSSAPSPTPSWRQRRLALHKRVVQVEGVRSLSQIANFRATKRSWTEPQMADIWARAAASAGPDTLNFLYVHVPFCKSICDFCNYERLRPSSPSALTGWRDRVLASIDTFAPAVEKLTFNALYFGGGTPSVLPAKILREVFEAIDGRLNWQQFSNRSIELDPAVVNEAKVEAMKDHGFHRYSFGVQTTDKEINKAHNRGPQGPEMVTRCLDLLPNEKGSSITADVLLGLKGVSPEDTLRDLDLLMSHPRRPAIDLFHLTPTHSYIDGHFGGERSAAKAAVAQYGADFDAALEALCQREAYTIGRGSSHHCKSILPGSFDQLVRRKLATLVGQRHSGPPGTRRAVLRKLYRGWRTNRSGGENPHRSRAYSQIISEVRAPFNLMGLGPSARSQVYGQAITQTRPAAGEVGPTSYVGSPVDVKDELLIFVLFDVRDRGKVLDSDLKRIFGTTLAEAMPLALTEWQQSNLVKRIEDGWEFQRSGRPSIAQDMLWAVPEAHLNALVARKIGGRRQG